MYREVYTLSDIIRVTVWNENRHETEYERMKQDLPQGLKAAVDTYLETGKK